MPATNFEALQSFQQQEHFVRKFEAQAKHIARLKCDSQPKEKKKTGHEKDVADL